MVLDYTGSMSVWCLQYWYHWRPVWTIQLLACVHLYSESINLLPSVAAFLLVARLLIALEFSLPFQAHDPVAVLDHKFLHLCPPFASSVVLPSLTEAFVVPHSTFVALQLTFVTLQSTERPQSFVSSLRGLRTYRHKTMHSSKRKDLITHQRKYSLACTTSFIQKPIDF